MYQLKIEKMHCKSCFLNIEEALKEMDESAQAKADFESRLLRVETGQALEKVKEAIESAGFPVDAAEKI